MKKENGPKLYGAVAQDSYNIGYKAVEQCVFAIENRAVTKTVDIEGAWWNKDNADKMIKDKLVYEG